MNGIKKSWVGVAWIVSGSLVLVGIAAFAVSSFFDGMCANKILGEMASPDGRRKVVVFERNCGSTSGFSTQASVLRVGQSLSNDAGNIFSADTNHGAAPSGPGGGPGLAVSWVGPKELVLKHHAQARVFVSESSIGDISVSYVSQ